MNKEVHYEGWLIKSPPSKRIWRSRWRRRWFTLKQGEIPEQFCLEYYTDRNCRKLKGIIDLDQCEQVDCGLRLENRKQKFQFMFDIKTPKRTYYLAADSAEDMRDWVNCICQVCHLHDTKHSLDDHGGSRFSNNKNTTLEAVVDHTQPIIDNRKKELNNETQIVVIPSTVGIHCNNVYQNSDSTYVNAEHSSSELLNNWSSLPRHFKNTSDPIKTASIERSLTVAASDIDEKTYLNTTALPSMNENSADRLQAYGNSAVRKVPENLILQNSPLLDTFTLRVQLSPSISTSSGPYIPISECFSGTPKYLETPTTPLNNLDPKFYDTPRSHNNIGLNLTNDKSYSPKITNCSGEQISAAKSSTTISNRSDSDSESVFTDDDDYTYPMPLRENFDRNTRPSDSSVENESFVLTYSQRFSKLPDDVIDKTNEFKYEDSEGKTQLHGRIKVYKNKRNLCLDIKKNERTPREVPQLSDTENTSPAIGPQDASSIVEESYDIPRSHQLPYHNIDQMFKDKIWNSTTKLSSKSTTSLGTSVDSESDSRAILRKHFYTNAAPKKFEGNVFRYDFVEHTELPPVNRKLKPKIVSSNKLHEDNQHIADKTLNNVLSEDNSVLKPPSVDRNLKPNAYKLVNSTLMEQAFRCSVDVPRSADILVETDKCVLETQTLPRSNCLPSGKSKNQISTGTIDVSVLHQRSASASSSNHQALVKLKPIPASTGDEHRLQYFDLDVANPPTVSRQSISTSNLTKQESSKVDSLTQSSLKSGVVYNSVDFVKTEAFKRIREERKKESGGVSSK